MEISYNDVFIIVKTFDRLELEELKMAIEDLIEEDDHKEFKKKHNVILEKNFKVIAVQDECFVDKKEEIIVFVRYEKQGKRNVIVKYEALSFPDRNYLEKWMTENGLEKAIPSEQFKAPVVNKALHLIRALKP